MSASIVFMENFGRWGSWTSPTPVSLLGIGYSRMSSLWWPSSVRIEKHRPLYPSSLVHCGSLISSQYSLNPPTQIVPLLVRLRLFFCPCATMSALSFRSFHLLRNLQQLCDAVPVPPRPGRPERLH